MVLAVLGAACGAPEAPPASGAPPATLLPMLQAVRREPIRERERFTPAGMGFDRAADAAAGDDEPPHATDTEAVAAAIAWIVARFGPLPDETALVATSIDHSAVGSDEPEDRAAHPGHTIVLRQSYRGTLTRAVSVVYLAGRSRVSGHFELAAFTPIAGSVAPVIGAEAAVEAVVRWAQANEVVAASDVAEFRRRAAPRLEFVRSPEHAPGPDPAAVVFRANWVPVPDEPCLVDAHSGRVWIDD
ncbi:MAG: hypothetical protein KF830_06690 [Planctomycetes bacterium]|nr:hypothetical protein [Planctomycetota bacterium]